MTNGVPESNLVHRIPVGSPAEQREFPLGKRGRMGAKCCTYGTLKSSPY